MAWREDGTHSSLKSSTEKAKELMERIKNSEYVQKNKHTGQLVDGTPYDILSCCFEQPSPINCGHIYSLSCSPDRHYFSGDWR